MSLRSMYKTLELTCKKGYYTHVFKTTKNLDFWTVMPNPSTVVQALNQVMSELNFRAGMSG